MVETAQENTAPAMISVVIVSWNCIDHLRKCLSSLSNVTGVSIQIIVVDNASGDESPVWLASWTKDKIEVIKSDENLGFGKACNLGAAQARGEFLLFLNPDTAIYPGTLEQTLRFMIDAGNADVGICGVQLIDGSSRVARSCARFPSVRGFVAQATGVSRLFPRLGHAMLEWAHDSVRDVDQVIGAFFLVRRPLFECLMGFDERFFMYFEEVDFSYRARQTGWRSVYLADVQAFHAGGGASDQVKARRLFFSLRSRLLYVAKHFSATGVTTVFLATLLLEPVTRSARALSRRSWSGFMETWQGYKLLWCWLPQWFFKGVTR